MPLIKNYFLLNLYAERSMKKLFVSSIGGRMNIKVMRSICWKHKGFVKRTSLNTTPSNDLSFIPKMKMFPASHLLAVLLVVYEIAFMAEGKRNYSQNY